jgi:hypothetical protein
MARRFKTLKILFARSLVSPTRRVRLFPRFSVSVSPVVEPLRWCDCPEKESHRMFESIVSELILSQNKPQRLSYFLGPVIAQAVRRRISPRRTVFASRAAHMGFVVDKIALGQVSLRVLRFSPVSIIPTLLHIYSYIIWGMENGPVNGRSSTET